MTQNQIAWLKLQEEKRHNVATEKETNRSNLATEYIGMGSLKESERHNVATEGIAVRNLDETVRHNKYNEQELLRSNLASESLKHESNVYNREVGMANVAESRRHNTAMEDYSYYSANLDYEINSQKNELTRNQQRLNEAELKGYFREDFAKPGDGSKKVYTEEHRHNVISEAVDALQAGASTMRGLSSIVPLLIAP